MKELNKNERIFMAIASLWLFVNIVIYFISKRTTPLHRRHTRHATYTDEKSQLLYPFGNYSIIEAYDFSELLIYGISPFVLFAIYKLFLKENKL